MENINSFKRIGLEAPSWKWTHTCIKNNYATVPLARKTEWLEQVAEKIGGTTVDEVREYVDGTGQPPESVFRRLIKAGEDAAILLSGMSLPEEVVE